MRIGMGLIIVALLLSTVSVLMPIARADTEPNDDFDHAELITPGTYTGSLSGSIPFDFNDFYKIVVSAGQSLSVIVAPSDSLAVWMLIYDTINATIPVAPWAHGFGDKGEVVSLSWTTNSVQASYTYYINLWSYNADSGDYVLEVSLRSQNDAGSGGDAGDSLDAATPITSANATYSGFLKDYDGEDYYKVNILAGQTLIVKVTPESTLAIFLGLYDPDGEMKTWDSGSEGVVVKASWTTNSTQANYTYYIQLYCYTQWSGGYGTYSTEVSIISQNDGNTGGDAGDSFEAATQIASANATYPGFLKDFDTDDYYKLNILAGQTLIVKVTPLAINLNLRVYNPNREMKVWDFALNGEVMKASWTTNSAQPSYTYYIRLTESFGGYGTYSMEISIISQNDGGSGGDAGDNLDTASPVNPGAYFGFLKDEDLYDCYKTAQTVTAGQGLYVRVIPMSPLVAEVFLYDEWKVQQAYERGDAGVTITAGTRATTTEIFYIKVHPLLDYGNYTMVVSVEPSVGVPIHKPQTPNDGEAVKVSVGVTATIKGVDNVILSYSTDKTFWTDVTMTLNATTGSYEGTIPGFTGGTKVYYKIKATNTVGDYFLQDNAGQYYTYTVEAPPAEGFPMWIAGVAVATIAIAVAAIAVYWRKRK